MSRELTIDEIDNFENDRPDVNHTAFTSWITEYKYPEGGPVQLVTTTFYCEGLNRLEKKCNAPTNFLVEGSPRCWVHTIRELNEMVFELKNSYNLLSEIAASPTPDPSLDAM